MQRIILRAVWIFLVAPLISQAAEMPPVGFFARAPGLSNVHISADGQYLLYTTAQTGSATLKTVDRHTGHIATVTFGDAKEVEITWCRWARTRRILCGLRGVSRWDHPVETTRLVAVDANGYRVKQLVDNGVGPVNVNHQIVSLSSSKDDSIIAQLLTLPSRLNITEASPDLVELDIYSGAVNRLASTDRSMPNAMDVFGDSNVFVARATRGDNVVFWTRSVDDTRWRELLRKRPLEPAPRPMPFALVPGGKKAYAVGSGTHHRAVFEMDLMDEHNDTLLYESEDADVSAPVYAGDGRLIGVALDTDQPNIHYLETRDATVVENANKQLPDRFNQIVDVTPDKKVYLLRSSSDIDPGAYYLLDVRDADHQLELLGSEYPELAQLPLPRTRTVHLANNKGGTTRAFLTTPLNKRTLLSPTIIMPNGAPSIGTGWSFDFLRQFLASRGYAVLQLQLSEAASARHDAARNKLASTGYDAIVNAAQWAIEQRIADPERIALVGWGYGGYLALLGAKRNPKLFHCAVSINGISDLSEWPSLEQHVDDDIAWLVDSKNEAVSAASPVLIINGARDALVHPHHAIRLMRSYGLAGVSYEHLEIRDGTHELQEQTGRAQALQRVEVFLNSHLQSQSAPATPLFRGLE